LREFLEWFVQTQLFEVFITRKLNPDLKFGLMFDEEVLNFEKSQPKIRQDMRFSAVGLSRGRFSSNKKLDKAVVIYKF